MQKPTGIIGIIPARMASTRFPGKPLALINGVPMIGHVYVRSSRSDTLDEVYVATCDQEIADYIERIGGNAIMTANTHERATDRLAEALPIIERKRGAPVDIVVMIQGDEPMVHPAMIDEAVQPMLEDETINVVNLMSSIYSCAVHDDPNEIKVVVNNDDFAMYFSREAIPPRRKGGDIAALWKQVNVVPFRRNFLLEYPWMIPTPLEIAESIDMLRVLEHGYRVKMVRTVYRTFSVDTPDDLRHAERLMRQEGT